MVCAVGVNGRNARRVLVPIVVSDDANVRLCGVGVHILIEISVCFDGAVSHRITVIPSSVGSARNAKTDEGNCAK
jgi:hypothetical protein